MDAPLLLGHKDTPMPVDSIHAVIGLAYLTVWFLIAHFGIRRRRSEDWVRHTY